MLISTPRSPVACGVFWLMASAHKRIMLNEPTRLTLMVLLNVLRLCAPDLPTVFSAGAMPAQLIKPNSGPIFVAASTAAWASASLLTSHLTKVPPNGRGHRLAFFNLHISDHHLCAVFGQHASRALAQPRGTPSDDEYG